MIYNQTVTRVRSMSTTKDGQGNVTADWGDDADRVTYTNVAVSPTISSESNNSADPRDQVFTGYRVSTRRGMDMDVLVTDRIEWADKVWSVSDTPQRWPHPVRPKGVHHVTVNIMRVEA